MKARRKRSNLVMRKRSKERIGVAENNADVGESKSQELLKSLPGQLVSCLIKQEQPQEQQDQPQEQQEQPQEQQEQPQEQQEQPQELQEEPQERPYTSKALKVKEPRWQYQRRYQAAYRKKKREQAELLAQQQNPIQQLLQHSPQQPNPILQQYPIHEQLQDSTQSQEVLQSLPGQLVSCLIKQEQPQEQQDQPQEQQVEPQEHPFTSKALKVKEPRWQYQRRYQAAYRKKKREQADLLAQQQNPMQQLLQYSPQQPNPILQQYPIQQQLQDSTQSQEVLQSLQGQLVSCLIKQEQPQEQQEQPQEQQDQPEEQQDQPQEQQEEPQERPSTSKAVKVKEPRWQYQKRYQAEYRKKKREQADLLAQQQNPMQQILQYSTQQPNPILQQYPIHEQLQDSTQSQEVLQSLPGQLVSCLIKQEQPQEQQEEPQECPSTSKALKVKEPRWQYQKRYQAKYRKKKREQAELLAQQQNLIQQQLKHSTQQSNPIQQKHPIEQQLQYSTQQQELEAHQAQQQQHAESLSYTNFMEHRAAHGQFQIEIHGQSFRVTVRCLR